MLKVSSLSDFEEIKEIGQGAKGSVYRAVHRKSQRHYALKKIDISHLKGGERKEALREVKLLRLIDHPNIIKYYGSFI